MPVVFKPPCTVYRLRMATRRATRLYDHFLAPSGLGIAQFGVLQIVARSHGATLTEIAATLDMDRTTLTRNLTPLLREGLVRSARGKDQRSRAVLITPAGEAAIAKALPMWRAAQSALRDQLGAKSVETLHELLDAALVEIPDT
jgi:DNA-binding MarR family transcriptional regulator